MSMKAAFKTKKKNENIKHGDSKSKLTLAFIILAIVGWAVLWLSALGDFFSFLIVFPVIIFLLFAVLVPSICSLFFIWMSEGYRNFIRGIADLIKSADSLAAALYKIFPYVAAIAAVFAITAFTLVLVFKLKKIQIKNAKAKLITSSIILGLTVLGIILGSIFIYAM